ncbi:small integral membrane protein 34A [Sarcophilus harrisii]|uniref:small integral membrane protein 34A n=1 Tax=Sarcophilus harrisii TaxID=9305 RepID=UPI001301FE70|nr:small integral membrane protein 34A [Sarcophilus harrisii]
MLFQDLLAPEPWGPFVGKGISQLANMSVFMVCRLTEWIPQIASNKTQANTILQHLTKNFIEEKNHTNSTRALKFPDGTSAIWYILTIFGIYGIIFFFLLASNILQNEKRLEDIYYPNLTTELKKRVSR